MQKFCTQLMLWKRAEDAPSVVRQIERGTVALLRGDDGTGEHWGVLHCSPSIEGSGVTRLLLAIDPA
jgi:hypothetical protein